MNRAAALFLPGVKRFEQRRQVADLIEEFRVRVSVVVTTLVRLADHGDDEIAIPPDLPVAPRRFEQVLVLFYSLGEIARGQRDLLLKFVAHVVRPATTNMIRILRSS